MAKSNGIKDLKQAAKLLNKHAPDGEKLAYINKKEAELLRAHGGSGIITLQGVPSYWAFPSWVPFVGDKELGEVAGDVWNWATDRYKNKPATEDSPGQSGLGNLAKDAASIWVGLEAKKNQEGLNEHEQKIYNDLKSQMAAAEREFAVNVAGGPAVTNVPTKIEDVASFTDVTLPTMKTTAVAEGGRIGYNSGGSYKNWLISKGYKDMLKGMSDDEIIKLYDSVKGTWSKAHGGRIGYNLGGIGAMDPRIGYQVGSSDIPGIPGVGKAMRDMDFPTFSEGVKQEFPSNELGVIDTKVQEDVSTTGGNQIQNSAMTLIQSGAVVDSQEALSAAYTLNAAEAQFPGVTNIALKLIEANQALDVMDAISQAVTIMEGSKNIQSTVGSTDFSEFIPTAKAYGGRIGAKEGGIMPLLNLGGMEKDYRQDGGFVPIGRREKADDVPARLSKNEFVFTADAVRAAGGGDIDQGAQRMYNVMKNLEAGGEISEQSQGKA